MHRYRPLVTLLLVSVLLSGLVVRPGVTAGRQDLTTSQVKIVQLDVEPEVQESGPNAVVQEEHQADVHTADSPPIALPRDCDGVTPPGGTTPSCCIYGYVWDGDTIVAGATVTITSLFGSLVLSTTMGLDSGSPYYRAALSGAPLYASAGDVITITASYGDKIAQRSWVVVSNGQQVDLGVLQAISIQDPLSKAGGQQSTGENDNNGVPKRQISEKFLSPASPRLLSNASAQPISTSASSGTWTTKACMPTPRENAAVVAYKGKVYVIGGSNSSGALSTVEVYDPATDTWSTHTSMPTAKAFAGAAVIGDLIYVVGGDTIVYAYDPATDQWITKALIPQAPDNEFGLGVVDGKLYVTKDNNWFYVYDPETDSWSSLTPIPVQRSISSFAVLNGKLYAIGGGEPGHIPSEVTRVDVYDPVTDSWELGAIPDMPTRRTHMGRVTPVVNGKIYVIGGWDGYTALSTVEIYDPETDSWITGPAMPTARYAMGFAVMANRIYAIGGNYGGAGGNWLCTNEVLSVPQNASRLLLVGGISATDGSYLNDLWSYDEQNWTQLNPQPPLPSPRGKYGMAYDYQRKRLVIFGGINETQVLSDTWEYVDGQWVQVNTPHSPSPRYDVRMVYDRCRDVIVLFGGTPGSYVFYQDTWEYDGEDWRQVTTTQSPPGSWEGAMVYDEARCRVVLMTGWQGGGFGWVNETWEYDGNDWVKVTEGPLGGKWRYSFAMAYDRAHERVILFGGYHHGGAGCSLNDTWEYDGQQWQEVNTLNKPPGRCGHTMAYEGDREVVVLYGGAAEGNQYFTDTWEYNGQDWYQVATTNSPSARRWTSLVESVYTPVFADFTASPTSGTAPLTVQFTDQSTGEVTSWQWDFGDGNSSTEQNPTHTYTTPGTYTVTLTVTGPGGSDTETKANYISVGYPAPVADFTASPTSGTAPLTVQFTDQSTGSIMAWDWLFGDGSKSGARYPLHTYENPGTYTVSLTVTGPGGSDTETKADYISVSTPPPVANFSASPLSGIAPLTVSFTDQSTGEITSWLWDFGDGSTSTEQNPTHTYTTPGTYTVTLTVTGPGGSDSFSRADYITVSPATETKTWTFMLYFAGDNDLAPYFRRAIEDMEQVQPRDNLNVLVLMDGWGEQDTYLYHIQYHPASGIGSTVILNPWAGWDGQSERNTGDPATLQHFITWARENYPADYYFLSIANHGRGTSGIAWDEDESSNGDHLTSYSELGTVLSNVTGGGADKIDVLMLDACLMALLEVDYEIKDLVDYIIAYQNLGWSVFAYDRYMQLIEDNTEPATFATGVAQAYFNARPDAPRTVSVLDVSQLPALSNAVDAFAQALITQINSGGVSQFKNIRDTVQVFDSYTPYDGPEPSQDEYIDLYHFAELVKTTFSDNPTLATAAQTVMDAVNAAVIYEAHQSAYDLWSPNYWDLDNAHGISIYFPPYSGGSDYERYLNEVEWAFTVSTQWDEFLFEYFSLTRLPSPLWQDPGYAPMLNPYYQVYLPIVVKER